jgi:hypothetical protein
MATALIRLPRLVGTGLPGASSERIWRKRVGSRCGFGVRLPPFLLGIHIGDVGSRRLVLLIRSQSLWTIRLHSGFHSSNPPGDDRRRGRAYRRVVEVDRQNVVLDHSGRPTLSRLRGDAVVVGKQRSRNHVRGSHGVRADAVGVLICRVGRAEANELAFTIKEQGDGLRLSHGCVGSVIEGDDPPFLDRDIGRVRCSRQLLGELLEWHEVEYRA